MMQFKAGDLIEIDFGEGLVFTVRVIGLRRPYFILSKRWFGRIETYPEGMNKALQGGGMWIPMERVRGILTANDGEA